MMTQVYSWDLCDHICKNLIIKIPGYQELIWEWSDSSKTYYKRAVFTMIASAAVHEKNKRKSMLEKKDLFLYDTTEMKKVVYYYNRTGRKF